MKNKKYILLINLGGPANEAELKPFLLRLFEDPNIIDIPGGSFSRSLLARLIVHFRSKRSAESYRKIGGGSPLLKISNKQAEKLQELLGDEYRVMIAMRYSQPLIENVLDEIEDGADLTVLPLYPQYSVTTTGSAIEELHSQIKAKNKVFNKINIIKDFYNFPCYINALAEIITESLPPDIFNNDKSHIIFSAHGLPVKIIDNGDPYLVHLNKTVTSVSGKLPFSCSLHLSFQSRTGPAKWLEPDTRDLIKDLAANGAESIAIVPISFVSENLETLFDQDIIIKQSALDAGIKTFYRIPAFNDKDSFIECLKNMILNYE